MNVSLKSCLLFHCTESLSAINVGDVHVMLRKFKFLAQQFTVDYLTRQRGGLVRRWSTVESYSGENSCSRLLIL
jgi:hypothetical protein